MTREIGEDVLAEGRGCRFGGRVRQAVGRGCKVGEPVCQGADGIPVEGLASRRVGLDGQDVEGGSRCTDGAVLARSGTDGRSDAAAGEQLASP